MSVFVSLSSTSEVPSGFIRLERRHTNASAADSNKTEQSGKQKYRYRYRFSLQKQRLAAVGFGQNTALPTIKT